MAELKSRAHSYGQNAYHFIWGPKYRIHMLKPIRIKKVCEGVLRLIAFQNNFIIHEIQVMDDHIHLFVEIPPSISVSKAFMLFKGKSSRILRRNFTWLRQFKCMWSKGKFYRSVGSVTAEVVQHYISHSQGSWRYFNQKKNWRYGTQTKLNVFQN